MVVMAIFVALTTISAQQTVVQNKDLDRFVAVNMSGKFNFRLKNSPSYSVRIISDERIADYVRPVVKNGIFSVVLDEKKYSPELKKELKAKGAAEPVLEVEVYSPYIQELVVREKAVLLDSDNIHVDNFKLNVSGSAKVNRLYLDCVTAALTFAGSSQSAVNAEIDTKLNVSTENSSSANISQKGGNAILKSKGASSLNLNVDGVDLDLEASGNAAIYISGIASMIDVEAAGSSMTDAEALEVREGNFVQSGSSKCHVNVAERMKVNLTGGCMLTFKRKPVIEVDRIVNSTLIKADDPKRK